MKRLITFFALIAFIASSAVAHDFEINGIYYQINSDGSSVSVTYYGTDNKSAMYSGDVSIPPSVSYSGKTYVVTTICELAFRSCKYLSSVKIPNTVTTIGRQAFVGCRGLTTITIPSSVTDIGWGLFGVTGSNMSTIVVEHDNPNYDSRNNCNAVIETATNTLISACNKTIIPNTITKIGVHAFSGLADLKSVEIPTSVTCIDKAAFYGCRDLSTLVIPNSVTKIGEIAFKNCNNLSVVIPDNLTDVGENAFDGCLSVSKSGEESIGRQIFYGTMYYGAGARFYWYSKNGKWGVYDDELKTFEESQLG